MKKYFLNFIILILIIITSCTNNDNTSFISLSNAFDKWYYIHNPYNSSTLDPYNFYVKNKIGDRNYMNEYLLDLKRFKLELNQINKSRLSEKNKYKYNSILNKIENDLYSFSIIKTYSNNPLLYIRNIRNNLLNILSDKKIKEYRKVEYVDSFLDYVPEYLERSKKALNSTNPYYLTEVNKSIIDIEDLMNMSIDFIKINYDINDEKISDNKRVLYDYKDFINNKLISEKYLFENKEKKIYNDYINKIETKYNTKNSIESLKLSIISLQNKIFNLSLPIYLLSNDEPIWVDREDTLKVINYVINKSIKKEITKDIESKIIEFNDNYKIIKNFIFAKNLFDLEELNISFPQTKFLFELHNNKIELTSSYNSYFTNIILPGNDKFIHVSAYNLFIINDLLPKMLFYNNKNKKSIYENDNLKYAWGKLMSNIFIENDFVQFDKNFELIYNIQLLRDFSDILFLHYIVNDNKNKKDIIYFLENEAFYTSEEAELQSIKLRFSKNNNLENYLTYLYLNNFYDLHCIINDKLTDEEFIEKIFKYGFIPVHNYNSILN